MPMDIKNLNRVEAFTTKDGSEIRELSSSRNSCIRNQSLAEARVFPQTLPSGLVRPPEQAMEDHEAGPTDWRWNG